MAEKQRLSSEDQKALDAALATIKRLQGEPPPPDPSSAPPVLRRYRILLNKVTWDEKTKRYNDNTTKSMVHDPKTGRAREVVIDRAIVTAYNEADAWQKFCKAWGISQSDHAGSVRYVEVRDLTEDELRSPPEGVMPMPENILVGVPPPKVLPIKADSIFNVPVVPPNVAVG